ncbi:hypothetical protein [Clostridium sardiniense]
MKNKVWENPTIATLNAKETMEENMTGIISPKCGSCGGDHDGPCHSRS